MNENSDIKSRGALIKRASLAGMIGNAILAGLKVIAGIISGSAAVIADGIDSASDIVASLITYYANSISQRPPDRKHPWGYQRIETIASKVISILIVFAGIQLVISTIGKFFNEEPAKIPEKLALIVTLFSIVGKAGISLYQNYIGKKTKSSMVMSDALHMRNDIYLSGVVLLGLGLTYLSNISLIDTILGAVLGFWIIWIGVKQSLKSNTELLDGFENQENLYKKIFLIVEKSKGIHNPHRVRVRKVNNLFDISLDIEVDGHLSVIEGHKIAQELENKIKKDIVNVFDVMVHVEPLDNEENEQFGVSLKELKDY